VQKYITLSFIGKKAIKNCHYLSSKYHNSLFTLACRKISTCNGKTFRRKIFNVFQPKSVHSYKKAIFAYCAWV